MVKKQSTSIKLNRLSSTSTCTTVITCTESQHIVKSTSIVGVSGRNLVLLKDTQFKIMKRVVLSVLCFVFAWSPYVFVQLYAQFGSNVEALVNPISASQPAMFAKTSSIYNPILYTISNKECRNFFRNKFF